jgi:hypothetical protein
VVVIGEQHTNPVHVVDSVVDVKKELLTVGIEVKENIDSSSAEGLLRLESGYARVTVYFPVCNSMFVIQWNLLTW